MSVKISKTGKITELFSILIKKYTFNEKLEVIITVLVSLLAYQYSFLKAYVSIWFYPERHDAKT